MKEIIIHLISDYSGQTVKYVASTALSRFPDLEYKKYYWPMIKNTQMLKELCEQITQKPGIVLYTLGDRDLRMELKDFCRKNSILCISVIGDLVNQISQHLKIPAEREEITTEKFDDSYFNKMTAIDYTLSHDDGKMLHDLDDADILLVGPSRTSKTPTSIFLAYNGFKTANIPFVNHETFPTNLEKLEKPIVFGFVINPGRLIEIRENRLRIMQADKNLAQDYVDIKSVQEECRQVRKLCNKNNWQIIDVSSRSIEETAAIITRAYYQNKRSTII